MPECLTSTEIENLIQGTLSPEAGRRANNHQATCEKCRQAIETHKSDRQLFDDVRNACLDETRPAGPEPSNDTVVDLEPSPRSPIANSIEGYEILSEIHRGGQGVVYKAVQKATKRVVAIKVMLQGSHATARQRHRFEREIDLVASLQHPNIVTVYDSGTTGEGLHFFAMEYIHGKTLTSYLADHPVTLNETLRMFRKICAAVNYAHQRGVIHRDLKPGNVRVDTNGEPHVLDFGLAKAAGNQLSNGAPVTVSGEFMGTLHYASPEQTRGEPGLVDTRSDVYSLGVMLYEVLTGEFPYPVDGQIDQVFNNIRTATPKRPSTIRRHFNNELETIVLKPLAKEKERRYQSAADLGNDIDRFLSGVEIDAKSDSLPYILRKRSTGWIARNNRFALFMVAVASIVLAMEVGTPFVYKWTAADAWYHRAVVPRLIPAESQPAFEHVRVIAFTDETDFEALARGEGLQGVRVDRLKSLRRLHGELMQRLVRAEPRVVVWDITFQGETQYDPDFVRGVQALDEAGIPVVVGVVGWWFDESSLPKLSRVIAPHVHWGSLNAGFSPDAPWRVDFAARRTWPRPLTSLSLAAVALWHHQDAEFAITLDPARELATIQYARPHPEWPRARMALSDAYTIPVRVETESKDSPSFGLKAGDVVGHLLFTMPTDSNLARVTIEYASVFRAGEETLREWFKDRVVVVGDRRPGIDRHGHPSDRKVSGCHGQASAIEKGLSGVHRPTTLSSATLRVSVKSGCVLLGLAIGLAFARFHLRRCLALAAFAAGLALVSVMLTAGYGWVWNPIVPFLALLLSCELCAAVHRVKLRRASLGN